MMIGLLFPLVTKFSSTLAVLLLYLAVLAVDSSSTGNLSLSVHRYNICNEISDQLLYHAASIAIAIKLKKKVEIPNHFIVSSVQYTDEVVLPTPENSVPLNVVFDTVHLLDKIQSLGGKAAIVTFDLEATPQIPCVSMNRARQADPNLVRLVLDAFRPSELVQGLVLRVKNALEKTSRNLDNGICVHHRDGQDWHDYCEKWSSISDGDGIYRGNCLGVQGRSFVELLEDRGLTTDRWVYCGDHEIPLQLQNSAYDVVSRVNILDDLAKYSATIPSSSMISSSITDNQNLWTLADFYMCSSLTKFLGDSPKAIPTFFSNKKFSINVLLSANQRLPVKQAAALKFSVKVPVTNRTFPKKRVARSVITLTSPSPSRSPLPPPSQIASPSPTPLNTLSNSSYVSLSFKYPHCHEKLVGWHDNGNIQFTCQWYGSYKDFCSNYGDKYPYLNLTANENCCECKGGNPSLCSENPEWYSSLGNHTTCEWFGAPAVIRRCDVLGDEHRNFGKTANEACCECGGGSTVISQSPLASPSQLVSPSPSQLVSPSPSQLSTLFPTPTPSHSPAKSPIISGMGVCGVNTKIEKKDCPTEEKDLNLLNCQKVAYGELCNGRGECGTNPYGDNCGTYNIYRKTLERPTSGCEKDNGKKFEYVGDKYSCKQLNKTKKKYRKRMCMRVKRARNLCPVICKYYKGILE